MHSGINAVTFGVASRQPEAVDPGEALKDMRLRSQRQFLESQLQSIGITLSDGEVEDLYDLQLKREYSHACIEDWEVVFLEVPRWIMSDGDKARDLDALRHGFRRKIVRFISPQLDIPSPAVRRVFEAWRQSDGIDAELIPWTDIQYLIAGETRLKDTLRVDSIPAAPGNATVTPIAENVSRKRNRVFISYSHQNEDWFKRVNRHLIALQNVLDVWSDKDIEPGQDWFPEIQDKLDRARVAIMLVTPEFVASEFIRSHEVPKIMDAAKKGDLQLFWILVTASHYEQLNLDTKQAAHDVSRPLDRFDKSRRNELLKEITGKVLEVFERGDTSKTD